MPEGSLSLPTRGERLLQLTMAMALFLFFFSIPVANAPALTMGSLALVIVTGLFTQGRKKPNSRLFVIILPFTLICLSSLIWSADTQESWKYLRREILLPALVLVAFYSLTSIAQLRWMTWGSLAGMVAIMAVVMLGSNPELSESVRARVLRYDPGVGDLSTFAVLLIPLLALFIMRLTARPLVRILSAMALMALILWAGFLTHNRMFWPATGVTLLALLFSWLWSRRDRVHVQLRIFSGVAVVLVLAIGLGFAFVKNAPQAETSAAEHIEGVVTTDPRWPIWRYWIEVIEERPWLGYGYGRFIAQKHTSAPIPSEDAWAMTMGHSHNILLNRASETGAIGLGLFVVMWILLGREYWRGLSHSGSAPYAIAGLALIVAYLSKNLTDDFYTRQNLLLFWALNGVLLRAIQDQANALKDPA